MNPDQRRQALERKGKAPLSQIAREIGVKESRLRAFYEKEAARPVRAVAPVPAANRSTILLLALTVAAAAFLIYSNSLRSAFQFDDIPVVLKNPHIRSLDPGALWNAFNTRFLVGLSLAANYAAGGLEPFGYHLYNVAVHAAASVAVFFLVLLTLRTPAMAASPAAARAAACAAAAALFFAAHPVQTQAVNYVWQRAASMAALAYVASLACYAKARMGEGKGWYAAAFVAGFAGMFAKETTFTLPLAILFYEFAFFSAGESRPQWGKALPFLLLMAVVPIALTRADEITLSLMRPSTVAVDGGFDATRWVSEDVMTRKDYLLTQISVARTYLRLLVFPADLNLDYDYPISRSIDPRTLVSLLLHAGIAAAAFFLWKKERALSYAVGWFYLALSIESAVVQRDVIFEHRLYLPAAAAALAWGVGLSRLFKDARLFIAAVAVATLALGAVSWKRNETWQTQRGLWEDVVRKSPKKARGHYNLANVYKREKDLDKAIASYGKAIEGDPKYVDAYLNLGNSYAYLQRFEEAIPFYEKAVSLDPKYATAYMNMGNAHHSLGRHEKALELHRQAIALKPRFAEAYLNMGNVYRSMSRSVEAERAYAESRRLKPAFEPKERPTS